MMNNLSNQDLLLAASALSRVNNVLSTPGGKERIDGILTDCGPVAERIDGIVTGPDFLDTVAIVALENQFSRGREIAPQATVGVLVSLGVMLFLKSVGLWEQFIAWHEANPTGPEEAPAGESLGSLGTQTDGIGV